MKRFIHHTILPTLAILAVTGCQPNKTWRQMEGVTWNTTYHIIYHSSSDLSDSVRKVMHEIETSLSPFDPNSNLSAINANLTSIADPTVAAVFTESQRVSRLSDGLFDPTVAPLVNLWGFGYRNETGDKIPTALQIDSAMQLVGINECHISTDGTITKKHPGTEFNFSSITKGYGCDAIGRMFQRNDCDSYMIEIGGEIVLNGHNPHGRDWRIMIDTPVDNDSTISHSPMSIINLTDCGVATSGNYRNFRQTTIGKTSHTIDPTTGQPITIEGRDSMIVSATVIAPTAMTADALATACMIMTPAKALSMVDNEPTASALLAVSIKGDSLLQLMPTSDFPSFEVME